MVDVAGRRQCRDPVLALPARVPQPTRCTSRDGPPQAASRSALLRRVRGLRHCRGPRRHAAFSRLGSGAHCRILAARRSRRNPRADPVLSHARHQRLAMGLDANPSRGSGSGKTRPLPSPPRHLREHEGCDCPDLYASALPPADAPRSCSLPRHRWYKPPCDSRWQPESANRLVRSECT